MTSTRLLLGLIVGALLAALVWVLLEPGKTEWQTPTGGTTQESEQQAAGNAGGQQERREAEERQREAKASEIDGGGAPQQEAVEVGIPAFVGRVLLPTGRAAAQATVEAFAFVGRARGFDPRDPAQRPLLHRVVSCTSSGRFAIPESTSSSFRWVLRIESPGLPPLQLVDLDSYPSRTRDLGDLQLSPAHSLRGVVLSQEGLPIVAAEVGLMVAHEGPRLSKWPEADLTELPQPRTQTGSDGSFQLDQVPAGSLRVTADFPGFVRGLSAEVELSEGAEPGPLELYLEASRPLRGTVSRPDGDRIAEARLHVRWEGGGELHGSSDAQGNFQLDLPSDASEIVLHAGAPGHGELRQRISGKTRDTPLALELVPFGALRGRVLDADGAPIAGAQVGLFENTRARLARVAPWQLQPIAQVETAADGRFELPADAASAPDGRLRVVAWADRFQPRVSATLRLTQRDGNLPQAVTEEIVLQLEPGLSVSGQVRTAKGELAAGARIYLRRSGSVRNQDSLSGSGPRGELVKAVTASATGGFAFPGLAQGEYFVEASLSGHSPCSSEPFALLENHVELDLTLLHACGIRGEVRGDRAGLPRLQVAITGEDGRVVRAQVGPDGLFSVGEMFPGAYEVDLFADVGALSGSWGRRVGPQLTEEAEVTVLEGQWTELVLDLRTHELAEVRGRVLIDGLPAADYRVFLVPAGYEGSSSERERQFVLDNMRSTHANAEGHYRFAGLGELDYWVVLAPPSRAGVGAIGGVTRDDGPIGLARARIETEEGKVLRQDFLLQTGQVIGKAVLEKGEREVVPKNGVAILRPVDADSGLRRFVVSLDRDGRFVFPQLPAGNWTLEVRAEDARTRTDPFVLSAGATLERELRLRTRQRNR